MALHRKWRALEDLRPDIAIIPEAASPDVLAEKGIDLSSTSTVWATKQGGSTQKGLLVAGFNGYAVAKQPRTDPELDVFLPVCVEGPVNFSLLAVWSFNHRSKMSKTPIADAIDHYAEDIAGGMLAAGDFNHNTRWDKDDTRRAFRPSVDHLRGLDAHSLYHRVSNEDFGKETTSTIYWRDRRTDGPRFMIDYIFEPTRWAPARRHFDVGTHDDWVATKLSDHVPLIAEWNDTELAVQLNSLKGCPACRVA